MAEDTRTARDYLAATLAAGAVVTGGALTYRSAQSDFPTMESLMGRATTQKADQISESLVRGRRQFSNQINQTRHLDQLRQRIGGGFEFGNLGETKQIEAVRLSYLNAVRAIEPEAELLIASMESKFPHFNTTQEAYSYVADQVGRSTSQKSTRLAQQFISNQRATAAHLLATGEMPTFMPRAGGLAALATAGQELSMAQLSPEMQSQIKRLSQHFGDPQIRRYARGIVPGSTLALEFSGGQLAGKTLAFDLAESLAPDAVAGINPGTSSEIVAVGRAQEHLYHATPGVVINPATGETLRTLRHEELQLRRMADSLIPQAEKMKRMSQSTINSILRETNSKIFDEQYLPGMLVRGGQYIPDEGMARYLIARGGTRQLFMEQDERLLTGNEIPDEVYDRALRTGVYSAETAPAQMAQGKYRLRSMPQHMDVFQMGQYGDPSRRPGQAFAHTPTAPSASARQFQRQLFAGQWGRLEQLLGPSAQLMGVDLDQLVVAKGLIVPKGDPQAAALGLAEDAGWFSREYQQQLGKTAPFASLTVEEPEKFIQNLIGEQTVFTPEQPISLRAGQILGLDPSLSPIRADEGMEITQLRQMGGGKIQVLGRTTTEAPEIIKTFGGQKAMMQVVPGEQMREGLRVMTGQAVADQMIENNLQFIGSASTRKNQWVQRQQIYTALAEFAMGQRNPPGTSFGARMAVLARDIGRPGDTIEGTHQRFVSRAYRLAKREGLSPEQMGLTFGSLGEEAKTAHPSEWGGEPDLNRIGRVLTQEYGIPGRLVSSQDKGEIAKRRSYGTFFLAHGEALEGNVMRASIEPRMFDILANPLHAGWGPQVAADLAERIGFENPELGQLAKGVQTSILHSLEPGSVEIPSNAQRINLQELRPGNFGSGSIGDVGQGGFLGRQASGVVVGNLPGGGELYIPPMGSIAKTDKGKLVAPKPWRAYEQYLNTIREEGLTPEQAKQASSTFREDITKQYADLFMEGGGLARAKGIPGTRTLTAVGAAGLIARTGERAWETLGGLPRGAAAVNPEDAAKMLEEMEMMGMGFQNRGAIMAGEAPMPSALWRHPLTAGTSAVAGEVFVHRNVPKNVLAMPVDYQEVSFELANGNKVKKNIDFGLARYMRGDFDADVMAVMPSNQARSEIQSAVNRQYRSGVGVSLAQEDAIRWGILEDAVWSPHREGGKTMEQAIVESAHKGRITQGGVGQVSNALSRVRGAVIASESMSAADKMLALGLLFPVEEIPISGKHAGGRFQELRAGLVQTVAAARAPAGQFAERFEGLIRGFTGLGKGADPLVEEFFDRGVKVDLPGGRSTTVGTPLRELSQKMERAIDESRSSESYQRFMRGRTKDISTAEALDFVRNPRGAMAIFQPEAIQATTTVARGANFSTRALAQINRLAAAGEKIIPHAKPLAIGLGAMLGIGAILSSPESPMSPPGPPPRANMSGNVKHRDITPESMEAQQNLGAPQPPRVVNQNRQMISPGRGAKLRVRSGVSEGSDLNRLQSRLPGGSRINIQDNRRQMRPYEVSDMMGAA